MRQRPTLFIFALALLAALAALPALAGAQQLTLDPEHSEVTFFLEATGHDVHGTLYLRPGHVTFDPAAGTAFGELALEAVRSESGNKKRDKAMRTKVFESASFPLIVFKPESFTGELAADGPSAIEIHGTASIVGGEHPLAMKAEVEINGETWRATTTFSVPYVEWGLRDPSAFMLRVAKEVEVTVAAVGTVSSAASADETD